MEVRTSKKRILGLVLSMIIVVGTAFGVTVVSNAYIPTIPTSCSGLYVNGETKTFCYKNKVINLGYSERYVLSAFGTPAKIDTYSDGSKWYTYSDGSGIRFINGVVVKVGSGSTSFKYYWNLPDYDKTVGIGSPLEDSGLIASGFLGSSFGVCDSPGYRVYSKVIDGKTYHVAVWHEIQNGKSIIINMTFGVQ